MKRFTLLILALLVTLCGSMPEPAAAQTRRAKTTQTASQKNRKAGKSSRKPRAKQKTGSAPGKKTKPRTAAEVKQAKQRNARDMKETRRKIQLNTRETEQRLNQLNLLEGEISDCNTNIAALSHSLDSINTSIRSANDSINALDGRLKAITDKYIKAIRRTQGSHNEMNELAFIFSSDSFTQAYRRLRSLRQFSKWRKRRSIEITAMRSELDKKRSELATMKQRAASALTRLNGEKNVLVKKQGETNELVGRLKKESVELQEIMSRRQREAASLDAELDRIIAEEAARQERLRIEREEAERKARIEAERKAREAEEARLAAEREAEQQRIAAEAKEAREAEERAQAAREAEKRAQEKAAEAERKARESADKAAKEQARKERQAAKKAEQERIKAEKEAQKKAREAEKQAAREKARKGKPVKHQGKNNGRGTVEAPATAAPTLKSPVAAGTPSVAPKADLPVGTDFASYRGRLPFPVDGRYIIVKRFGRQQHPTLPHVQTTNSGIDMQTTPGATVRTVFDGEVSAVFRPDGYNNVVVIRHGQYMTVYANLGSITVSTGQKVKAGQPIGSVYTDANDGNRSILHFEIRNRRAKENPELWLKQR